MTDLKAFLIKLNKNLNILKEREAKHAGNAPLDLLNQIDDHQKAIDLTEQAIRGEMSQAEWEESLKPLLVSLEKAQVLQIVLQSGLQMPQDRNLPAQLATLQHILPHLTHPAEAATTQAAVEKLEQAIAELPAHEQNYRARLKAHYSEKAAYFVELISETQIVSKETPALDELDSASLARFLRGNELAEYHEWVQAGPEIKRVKLNTLRAGVDKYPCIILLGEPGCGKTTALENLAYQFADPLPIPPPASGRDGEGVLPLPLRLSEFGPGLTIQEFIRQSWTGSEQAGHWGAPELAANLAGYLEAGKLFVLFDALNEMPREGYKERALALRYFIDHWSAKGNRFLVSCRVLDYGEELSGLQRVEIQPFNDEQIRALMQKVLPKHWPELWQVLAESKDESRRLLGMARNPYLLNMMIYVFGTQGQLGQNRAELMSRFIQILLAWAKKKCPPEQWLEAEVQIEALSVTAFEMQKRAGSGAVVESGLVKTVMPSKVQTHPDWPPRPTPPDQVLSLAASANIIELPVDRSTVRFYHQLLQEYFAAREMLKRIPSTSPPLGGIEGGLESLWRWKWLETETPLWERPEDNYDPLPPPETMDWEETTILAAGLAPENDDQLLQALIEINPVIAGRCLYEGQAKVDKTIRQAVIEALLATIAQPEVALRVRIAAGEALGYLGDPRLGEMVTIPAGKFLMGDDNLTNNEKPQHELFLPEYQIGKYSLTNAEYARFIEAGGYLEKWWWTKTGWRWKGDKNEPYGWDNERFNKPNLPVVYVTWYECVAYCRWLSAETRMLYRLPAEAEWEKAARGVDGRQYPWGDEFDASRLNAREGSQQVRNTTPVGIYPTGVSPFGAFDCAGNVWEWTISLWGKDWARAEFKYPYNPTDGRENMGAGNDLLRVWRGGSFDGFPDGTRCASRGRSDPYNWLDYAGFRCVVE